MLLHSSEKIIKFPIQNLMRNTIRRTEPLDHFFQRVWQQLRTLTSSQHRRYHDIQLLLNAPPSSSTDDTECVPGMHTLSNRYHHYACYRMYMCKSDCLILSKVGKPDREPAMNALLSEKLPFIRFSQSDLLLSRLLEHSMACSAYPPSKN